MLINKLSINDYQEILDTLHGDPKFAIIYFCLKSELNCWSPTTKVVGWKLFDDSYIAYGVLNILQSGKPYFHMQSNIFDIEKSEKAAKYLFIEILPFFRDEEDFCIACPNEFMISFRKLFVQTTPFIHILIDDGGILFYIDEKSYEKYIDKEIIIPEKYIIDKLSPEDSEMMVNVYLFKGRGDINRITNRINEFPNVCIKDKESNKIVSFIHNDGYGFLAHQYTFPDYRKQGLGTICEKSLSKFNKKLLNIIPLKGVSIHRKYVLEYTRKSGYWRRIPSSIQQDTDIYWTVFSKKNLEKVIAKDN
ncbi:Acyl-CoA N-acyltransferase domain-containing protein [Strongyloides ratti]|uniref:Glycine N-acyltransferase-like protein n=1 Tax=Strongyloides ratti TaxID=34506 RepID=A0A090MX89_STRRB|nr:Acyl-CoA N-acyltransferase domain-containing protein [Strongyloides ratti]CEF65014.1 Acyl-CoA N-acyltransferase domain-containing protein [Strongyloides ratti]